ncbi:MAG: rRNA methyltransferase [Planctomycetaceae bacterium]|nr:rRNA methyltransferase [Planctomycetaceae bacterium]|tara:strand:+ start:2121 stop:2927 length:807 start_codon:yes stop_codon:yes gene_type:complete
MTLEITSPQNPRIKELMRLRERRGRQKQKRFMIDGLRELQRACDTDLIIDEVYFDVSLCDQTPQRETLTLLEIRGTTLIEVSQRVMQKISYGQQQPAMIAVAKTPAIGTLSDLAITSNTLIIVLEAVEKPGNLGAIVRTADAAGVQAVIFSAGTQDIFNPNAIRNSSGAIFHIPVIHTDHDKLQSWLSKNTFKTLATRVDGAINYTQADYTGRTAIIMGSEATGLSQNWDDRNSSAISIPMLGIGDSLNVSTSCAVICFEALRQRGHV